MPWSTIASNQCVSRDNLINAVATGVFFQKNTIPAGTKQITKAEAEYYVDINTISGKSSNQLVVKSNLVFPGYFYEMDRYNCNTCTPDDIFPIAYSSVPLTFNYYYAGTSPYTYRRLNQIASTAYTLNFSSTTGTVNCVSCAPPLVTYYELAQCPGGFGYQFTAIVPNLGTGQRYVLPSGSPIFYTYTGASQTTSTPPAGYNASIQRTTSTGCP